MLKHFAKSPAAIAALIAGFVLAACDLPPEARTALSDGPAANYDARIVGDWAFAMDADEEAFYLKINRGEQPGTLQAVFAVLAPESAKWGHLTVHPTAVGGKVYYNARRTAGKGTDYTARGERPGYLILRAFFAGPDVMIVCALHGQNPTNKGAAEMLAKYGVRTRKSEGDDGQYLTIEASRQALLRLIETAPERELFGAFLPFVRLGAPRETMAEIGKRTVAHNDGDNKGCPFE